jgi:hypothetical protein
MARDSIVIVLGAGASVPYGYPAGEKLYNDVCKHCSSRGDNLNAMQALGFDEKDILAFRDELFFSGEMSIDSFLENRRDEIFLKIGKAAIALELVPCEAENILFMADEPDPRTGWKRGKWYKYFKSILAPTPEDLKNTNVSILTYNYDRSLDHFLFKSISSGFDLDEEEFSRVFPRHRLIHLHGQLGFLPWQDSRAGVREYAHKPGQLKRRAVLDSSERITFPFEDWIENGMWFKQAKKKLAEAKLIVFLGFGYGTINVQRIRDLLPKAIDSTAGLALAGTALGLSENERRRATSFFGNNKIGQPNLTLFDRDIDVIRALQDHISWT